MEAHIRTAEELRYLILAIQREGNRVLAAGLRPVGLTPSQGEVLRVLRDYQPLTLTGLGELLICEHGNNPSRLVDRLVSAGLVQRETHADDRRQVTLTLTNDGGTKAEQVIAVEDQMYEALDALTAGQPVEQTLKTLRTLAEVFPVAEALHRRNGALYSEGAGIVSASIAK
jgi:MarR family transcriptional regulator, organic hydroperoxide resistance regulator